MKDPTTMSEEIRRHVEHLNDELGRAVESGDANAAEIQKHVAGYLASEDPTDDDHADLRERVGEAVVGFHTDHPTLSGALQGVIDALTAAGI